MQHLCHLMEVEVIEVEWVASCPSALEWEQQAFLCTPPLKPSQELGQGPPAQHHPAQESPTEEGGLVAIDPMDPDPGGCGLI